MSRLSPRPPHARNKATKRCISISNCLCFPLPLSSGRRPICCVDSFWFSVVEPVIGKLQTQDVRLPSRYEFIRENTRLPWALNRVQSQTFFTIFNSHYWLETFFSGRIKAKVGCQNFMQIGVSFKLFPSRWERSETPYLDFPYYRVFSNSWCRVTLSMY